MVDSNFSTKGADIISPLFSLENWYYRVLVLLTGKLPDPQVVVDSLSICMNINGWEMMIPLGFFVAAGVWIANELASSWKWQGS